MRSVGLEIGDGFLRAVEVEGGPKGASIRKFVQTPVSLRQGQSAEDAVAAAIDGLFRTHSLPRGNVVISLDSTEATLRELSMPIVNDDQLKKTVKYEYEHHVHTKSVDDMIVDYYKIDTRDKSTLILAAGIPKKVIEHRLELCARSRIDPTGVDLDVFALFNGAIGSGALEEKSAAFFLLVEPRFTKLLTIEEGRLRFVRNIRLTQAARGNAPAANDVQVTTTGTYQVAGTAAMAEVLAKQISHSLLSHPLKHSITHLIVAGSPDVVQGIVGPLQEKTSITTEAFVPDPEQLELSASAVALGLAFRGLGLDHVGTDYRKEEFKFERRYETVKKSAFLCLCMVAVLLGLIALYYRNRFITYDGFREGVVELQRQQLKQLYQEDLQQDPPAEIDDPARKTQGLLKEYQEGGGGGDHPIPVSALQRWKQVFERLGGTEYLTVASLTINVAEGRIELRGKVASSGADKLIDNLKSIPDLDPSKLKPTLGEMDGNNVPYTLPLMLMGKEKK